MRSNSLLKYPCPHYLPAFRANLFAAVPSPSRRSLFLFSNFYYLKAGGA
jgi:hypothetical protein